MFNLCHQFANRWETWKSRNVMALKMVLNNAGAMYEKITETFLVS